MNLVDLLKLKYPNARNLFDYQIADPGDGNLYISQWNLDAPKPTAAEIASWMKDPDINLQNLAEGIADKLRVIVENKPAERGYDNIATLSSYVTSSNLQWKAEAEAFIMWRDAVFDYAYTLLANVKNGTVPPPTEEQFLAALPALLWPEV